MHNSLPDMSFSWRGSKDLFDPDYSLHQSMPSMPTVHADKQYPQKVESERKPAAMKDMMEPIPFSNINIPGRISEKIRSPPTKSEDMDVVKKGDVGDFDIPSNTIRSAAVSRDLMECLDKMTYHSIADDKLFEPLPFSQSDRKSGMFTKEEPGPLDESERGDEFAEG